MEAELIQQLIQSNEQLAQSNQILASSNDALFLAVWALIAGLAGMAFVLGTKVST